MTSHPQRKDCYNCGMISCDYRMIDGTGVTTPDAVDCPAMKGEGGYPCIEFICEFCDFKEEKYCKFCRGGKTS